MDFPCYTTRSTDNCYVCCVHSACKFRGAEQAVFFFVPLCWWCDDWHSSSFMGFFTCHSKGNTNTIVCNHLFVQGRAILMYKELNHFGVIAGLFRQIGGHSSRFVLFCSFWRLFTIKMIKTVKVFPFSFWKIITTFFLLHKIQTPSINMQNGRQVI